MPFAVGGAAPEVTSESEELSAPQPSQESTVAAGPPTQEQLRGEHPSRAAANLSRASDQSLPRSITAVANPSSFRPASVINDTNSSTNSTSNDGDSNRIQVHMLHVLMAAFERMFSTVAVVASSFTAVLTTPGTRHSLARAFVILVAMSVSVLFLRLPTVGSSRSSSRLQRGSEFSWNVNINSRSTSAEAISSGGTLKFPRTWGRSYDGTWKSSVFSEPPSPSSASVDLRNRDSGVDGFTVLSDLKPPFSDPRVKQAASRWRQIRRHQHELLHSYRSPDSKISSKKVAVASRSEAENAPYVHKSLSNSDGSEVEEGPQLMASEPRLEGSNEDRLSRRVDRMESDETTGDSGSLVSSEAVMATDAVRSSSGTGSYEFRATKGFALVTAEGREYALTEELNLFAGELVLRDGMYRSPRDVAMRIVGIYEWAHGLVTIAGDLLYDKDVLPSLYGAFTSHSSRGAARRTHLASCNLTLSEFSTLASPLMLDYRRELRLARKRSASSSSDPPASVSSGARVRSPSRATEALSRDSDRALSRAELVTAKNAQGSILSEMSKGRAENGAGPGAPEPAVTTLDIPMVCGMTGEFELEPGSYASEIGAVYPIARQLDLSAIFRRVFNASVVSDPADPERANGSRDNNNNLVTDPSVQDIERRQAWSLEHARLNGAPRFGGSGKKRGGDNSGSGHNLAVRMKGWIESPACGTRVELAMKTLDTKALFGKAMNYTLMVTVVSLVQVLLLVRQMEMTSTQAGASRVSLVTIGLQAVADSYLCLCHLTIGIAVQSLFNAFATAAFFKFVLFSIFEMRYMLIIWKARRPAAFNEGWEVMRRELSLLYSRFYGSLLLGVVLLYHMQNHLHAFMLLFYSFWVPQIASNVINDHRRPLHLAYLLGTSLTRLAIPCYFLACPNNFLHVRPQPELAGVLASWMAFQVIVLCAQQRFGSRWFIPRRLLPEKYDYFRALSQAECASLSDAIDLESGGVNANGVDCVICMHPVLVNSRNRMAAPCNHLFHEDCLQQWMDVKMECPTCRRDLPPP